MYDLIIRGDRLVLENEVRPGIIAVKDGVIAAILNSNANVEAEEVLDCTGKVVLPGAIDPHSHVTYCDDFASGTRTSASGGVTTIIEMPLSMHYLPVVNPTVFGERIKMGEATAHADFALWGGVRPDAVEDSELLFREGAAAFKVFMNYVGEEYRHFDDYSLLRLMECVRKYDGLIGVHAENESICAGLTERYRREGRGAEYHSSSHPPITEIEAVSRLCLFARESGCRIHVCHVSTPEAAEVVLEARARGARITYETCPHYLTLSERDIERCGPYAKCNPPMRNQERVEALWDLLLNGMIDCIGSDHSAYSSAQKEVGDFWTAPGGFPGMDVMLPSLISEGIHKRGMSWILLSRVTSTNAAKTFGLSGRKGAIRTGLDADFAIVDPDTTWVFHAQNTFYANKSEKYPYEGRRFKGKLNMTIVRGDIVFRDGVILSQPGYGRFIPSSRQDVEREEFK